jgi:hypothetical protein
MACRTSKDINKAIQPKEVVQPLPNKDEEDSLKME